MHWNAISLKEGSQLTDLGIAEIKSIMGQLQRQLSYSCQLTDFQDHRYCSLNPTLHSSTTQNCLELTMVQGGLHRGGQGGGGCPPNLSIGGASPPPNFRLQYKGVPKSPLLSLFCNSVYWLKPHNNVNSRPPNLAILPPPLMDAF